jgi:GAF domain-containing protein
MNEGRGDLVEQLGKLAADIGPALVPVGHEELLRSITAMARRLFDAAACSIALLDDAGEELTFHTASGAGADDVTGLRMPAGRGVAGWVVMSGQAIAIEDVRSDPRFASDVAAQTGYVPRSILAMPLETERRMIGVIEVLDRQPGAARPEDMEFLGLLANLAALAIESSRLFSNLGQALLEAAGRAADGDLATALERQARAAPKPSAEMAELARLFHELGQVGPEARRSATRIVEEFLGYSRRR